LDWKERAKELKFKQGLSWGQASEIIQKEYFPTMGTAAVNEKIRGYIRRLPEYKRQNTTFDENKSSIELNKDGTTAYDRLISICEGEELTPELLMEKHNLDPAKWKVISYKNNYWHSQVKGGTRLLMYQSKVVVKPLNESEKLLTYIDDYLKNKQFKYDKPLTKHIQYDP